MSLKIRRYVANQSNFVSTDAAPLTQVDVPASVGFTDLTQCRMVLDMQVSVTDNLVPVVFPTSFGRGGQMLGAQSLIRNSKVRSREFGLMNEQRHQNVISSNLDWYKKSRAREDAESTFGASTSRNYGVGWVDHLPDCPFIEYRGSRPTDAGPTGTPTTTSAALRRAEIPIPWKHFDQFASIAQFPNVALGDLSYHMEFENQIQSIYPAVMPTQMCVINSRAAVASVLGNAAAPLTTTLAVTAFNRPPLVGDRVRLWFAEAASTVKTGTDTISAVTTAGGFYVITLATGVATTGATPNCTSINLFYGDVPVYACDNVTAAGNVIGDAAARALVLQNFYNYRLSLEDNKQCPFYVGCPVRVVAANSTLNSANETSTTISSLSRNNDDLLILLTTPLNVGGNNPCTNIYISHRDHSTAGNAAFGITWTINEVYAELFEIQLTPNQREAARKGLANLELPFYEQRLLQKDMPSSTVHTDVVQIDPNCLGLAVLTPQTLTFLSGFENCTSYRYAIDGVSNTNRDINVGNATTTGRQLHNIMLKNYFGNTGMPLMKYDAQTVDFARVDNTATHAFFPLVTPYVPRSQIVQIQLFASTAMSQKSLFYVTTHARVLKLSSGRVQLL